MFPIIACTKFHGILKYEKQRTEESKKPSQKLSRMVTKSAVKTITCYNQAYTPSNKQILF